MDKPYGMLVINVGSTSTKLAWLKGEEPVVLETIRYRKEDLAIYPTVPEQLPRREADVLDFLEKYGISPEDIDMVVSRGGLGRPAPGKSGFSTRRGTHPDPSRFSCRGTGHSFPATQFP